MRTIRSDQVSVSLTARGRGPRAGTFGPRAWLACALAVVGLLPPAASGSVSLPVATATFAAAADARVGEASSSTNWGSSSLLRVDGGTNPRDETFLRFEVSGLSGTVVSATLRVYAASPTDDGPAVYATASDWSEDGITWSNRPAPVGAATDDAGPIPNGSWAEFDVTSLVPGNGTYSFVLIMTSSDGVNMSSREGSPAPELVVSTVAGTSAANTAAPTAPTGLALTGVTASTVGLVWLPSTDDAGVAGYNVYVDGTKSGTTSLTAYTATSLACSTTYTFGVEAYDQAGNVSPRANVVAATTACLPGALPGACTKTLAAGGDLSTFVASLRPADVGCLRGGRYTDGLEVHWSANGTALSRITLTSYPGEKAELVGTTLVLDGDYLTVRNLTLRDLLAVGADGIAVSGNADRVEHNVIRNVYEQGILLHTDSSNATITGNDVREVGQPGSNLDHGIYVQGDGHVVVNNVFAQIRGGYGIHVYPSSSAATVAQNTVVGSQTRAGIIIDTSGGDVEVVNNVLVGNATYGIVNRRCDLGGCVVDTNLAWDNAQGAVDGPATHTLVADPKFADAEYHVAAGSPVIDAARSDYSFSPDRDWALRPLGGGPDLGAYER